jgi:mycothiol synthase
VSWTVRPASLEQDDLEAIAAVVTAVTPEYPTSVEEMRWDSATYPDGCRFIAEEDGAAVGAAFAGRIYMYPATFERAWLELHVLATHRRRGIGTEMYRQASLHARTMGKTGLQTDVSAERPEALAFLQRRGFEEFERSKSVRLHLGRARIPDESTPDGVSMTTLAERPDLARGVHAVAVASFPDIPHADEPVDAGTFDEFRVRDIERPGVEPEGFHIALDEGTGDVVGYASLLVDQSGAPRAWHDMTAVHPGHRGRRIATALKVATIRWAATRGIEMLDTGNDVANGAMRAINARLGYEPLPDEISMRGPLHPGIMGR